MTSFRSDGELIGMSASPTFGIGQRALLVQTAGATSCKIDD